MRGPRAPYQGALDDPVDGPTDPVTRWTTAGIAEAYPGTLTPLNWTVQHRDRSWLRAYRAVGLLSSAEATGRRPFPPIFGIFCGHVARSVDFFAVLGDRIPGNSGARAVAEAGFDATGTVRVTSPRYLSMGLRGPAAIATVAARLGRLHRDVVRWWSASVWTDRQRALGESAQLLEDAVERFHAVVELHVIVTLIAQRAFGRLSRLAHAGGEPHLVAGFDSINEDRIVRDLRATAAGERELGDFLREHGFHTPAEGELSSRAWREDPGPVLGLLEGYRELTAAQIDARGRAAREAAFAAERRLLAAFNTRAGLEARLCLALARRFVPAREIGRASYAMALDVARKAAREVGAHLARGGVLDDPEDVFFLTYAEVLAVPPGAREIVAIRRRRHEEYRELRLPPRFVGRPTPIVAAMPAPERDGPLRGLGVSPGAAEGRARVALDPTELGELCSGEILVCPSTDPAWAAVFPLLAGLVVDTGGPVSHGAIIAREFGIPCVMGTGDAVERIRTGDWVSIDGASGAVEHRGSKPAGDGG